MRRTGSTPPRRHRGVARGPLWALPTLTLLAASCGGEDKEAPLPPPPRVVEVDMREYRFDYTPRIPRGRVVFRAHNRGRRAHEIVLVPVPENFPPIDKQLHSKTRRPVGKLAHLRPLRPGESDAFAVDLVPGRYAMVDFITARDGEINGLKGMNSEFRVR